MTKSEAKQLDIEIEALKAEKFALFAGVRLLELVLDDIDNELNEAAQDDCENGVKWLNENAASKYLKEYPHTASAIKSIVATIREVLSGGEDKP